MCDVFTAVDHSGPYSVESCSVFAAGVSVFGPLQSPNPAGIAPAGFRIGEEFKGTDRSFRPAIATTRIEDYVIGSFSHSSLFFVPRVYDSPFTEFLSDTNVFGFVHKGIIAGREARGNRTSVILTLPG